MDGGEVRAPAKLTLSLRVTGVRPDGYHLLRSEMVSLDLADSLYFSDGAGLDVVDGGAGDAGFGLSDVPSDGTNLVTRALALAGRQAHVRLVKRVPPGAGLGGGSSDAAAVLRWLGIGKDEGLAMSAKLGSDVPFCYAGGGRALVTGTGGDIEQLPLDERLGQAYTLVIPPFGVATAAVYSAWDSLGGPQGPGPNDLERPALLVEPKLARWRDKLGEETGQSPVLAGSGSTWFVAGEHPGEGRLVVHVAHP